jgi:hypothetical protein
MHPAASKFYPSYEREPAAVPLIDSQDAQWEFDWIKKTNGNALLAAKNVCGSKQTPYIRS